MVFIIIYAKTSQRMIRIKNCIRAFFLFSLTVIIDRLGQLDKVSGLKRVGDIKVAQLIKMRWQALISHSFVLIRVIQPGTIQRVLDILRL